MGGEGEEVCQGEREKLENRTGELAGKEGYGATHKDIFRQCCSIGSGLVIRSRELAVIEKWVRRRWAGWPLASRRCARGGNIVGHLGGWRSRAVAKRIVGRQVQRQAYRRAPSIWARAGTRQYGDSNLFLGAVVFYRRACWSEMKQERRGSRTRRRRRASEKGHAE